MEENYTGEMFRESHDTIKHIIKPIEEKLRRLEIENDNLREWEEWRNNKIVKTLIICRNIEKAVQYINRKKMRYVWIESDDRNAEIMRQNNHNWVIGEYQGFLVDYIYLDDNGNFIERDKDE